jgi:hypothetical protein
MSATCVWPGPGQHVCESPLGAVLTAGLADPLAALRESPIARANDGLDYAAGVSPVDGDLGLETWPPSLGHGMKGPPVLASEWRGATYTFLCLLFYFRLATAPWVSTKITRLLVCRWRNISCIGYTDNFHIASPSLNETAEILQSFVLPNLGAARLQLNV